MTNPPNKFKDILNLDKDIDPSLLENYKPTIMEVVRGLIDLTAHTPLFYKDENTRMMVNAGILYATQELRDAKENGDDPKVSLEAGAYMMLLGDIMSMTYDAYAGEVERERFPHSREDYEDDVNDLFGK